MSLEIEAMTDGEVWSELQELQQRFTDDDFDKLEYQLKLKAGVLGWTGDPLVQPARSVLAAARGVIEKKEAETT